MALNFPSSPTHGQSYISSPNEFSYDSDFGKWVKKVNESTVAEYRAKAYDEFLSPGIAFDAADEYAVADASTITLNMDSAFNFRISPVTGATTLAFSNIKSGQAGHIRLVQAETSTGVLSYDSTGYEINFASGTKTTLSTDSNAVDLLFYKAYDSDKIVISSLLGLA